MIPTQALRPATRAAQALRAAVVGAAVGLGAAATTGVAVVLGLTSASAIAPVAIAVAGVVAAMHYWKTQQALISDGNERSLQQALRRFGDSLAETQGLVQLASAPLPFPLAFGGVNALTADAAAILAHEVAVRRPGVVVELGSGASTILVACLLRRLGRGRIYSLQHDREHAAETRRLVAAAGLDAIAEVLDAPLAGRQVDDRQYRWYSIPEAVDRLERIDLLIVDGPPQRIDPTGLPRYPALPFFAPRLAEGAVVFVDDARRPAEMETIRLWLELCPGWEAHWMPTARGTFVLTRRAAATQ